MTTRTPAHRPRIGRPAALPPRTPRVPRWPSASHGRWPPAPGRHPAAGPFRSARFPAPPLPQPGCFRCPSRVPPAERPPGGPGNPRTRTRTGLASPRRPHRFRGSSAAPSWRPAPGAPRPRARRAARGPGGLRPAADGTSGTGSAHNPRRRAVADGPQANDRIGTPAGSRRHPGRQRPGLIQRQPATTATLVRLPRRPPLGPLQPAEGRLHRRGPVGTPIPVRRHAAGPLVASRRAGSPWTGRWRIAATPDSQCINGRASPAPRSRPVRGPAAALLWPW